VREEHGRVGAARLAPALPSIMADRSVSPFRWLARAAPIAGEPR
jgi:hypothetical protein